VVAEGDDEESRGAAFIAARRVSWLRRAPSDRGVRRSLAQRLRCPATSSSRMDAAGSSRAYLARCRRSPPVRMQAPAQPLPSHPLALRVHRALGSPAANAATRPLPVRTMLGTTAASFDPTRVLRAIERNDRVTFELYWCPNPRLAYVRALPLPTSAPRWQRLLQVAPRLTWRHLQSDEDIYLLTRALRNNTVLRSISIIVRAFAFALIELSEAHTFLA